MKKVISLLLALTLVFSILTSVSAYGNGQGKGSGDGTGTPLDDDGDGIPNRDDPDYVKSYKNQDNMKDDDNDGVPNGQDNDFESSLSGTKEQKENINRLKTKVNEIKKTNTNVQGNSQKIRSTKLAIQGLKLMNQYTNSSIGQKVSQIANEYEQKYQQALSIEEKINQRSGLSKFLFGGDKKLAESLNNQVRENQALIQELVSQLVDASDEEREFVMEQINDLKAECVRLEEIANKEANRKGLFKWW